MEAVSDSKTSLKGKKTWFHFRAMAPKNVRIRFMVENVGIYENMYEVLFYTILRMIAGLNLFLTTEKAGGKLKTASLL